MNDFHQIKTAVGKSQPKNIILGIPRPVPSPHIQSTALYFLSSGIDNKWEYVVYL